MVRYLKTPPTVYVMQYQGSRLKREGAGLSFFYWAPTTTLVQVPLASADVPFAFQETTADFQSLTVQGQLTYRVVEPRKLASLLDYTVGPTGDYRTDDPRKLEERLVYQAQVLTRGVVQRLSLKGALGASEQLGAELLAGLRQGETAQALGVQVLSLAVLSLQPTPEMARALEAEAREALQRASDEAISARRFSAVEQERRIKESELQSDVMVEQQRRLIRETKMAADIALETEREQLVTLAAANDAKAAEAKAYQLDQMLKPLRALDWKVLTALSSAGQDPAAMIAVAFRELAENAERIGELNVSPDLLQGLLGAGKAAAKR